MELMKPKSTPPTALLVSRDLFFTSKVTATAAELGLRVEVVVNAAAAIERVKAGGVRCVFVDLADPAPDIDELVSHLPPGGRPAVVAFGAHVAAVRLEAARQAGCDEVLPRSRFSAVLPDLLRKYLSTSA